MEVAIQTAGLILVLLNPFLVIIYLLDVVEKLDKRTFASVMLRAWLIATVVFCVFALLGEAMFTQFLQADFASFQIFGGIVFLLIGLQFVFQGPRAITMLRGESEHLAGAIAMPVLIGPGTISASIIAGKRLEPLMACIVIAGSVALSCVVMVLLKWLHDAVRKQQEALVQRYIEIAGRIMALVVGTVAVEMIMRGAQAWAEKF